MLLIKGGKWRIEGEQGGKWRLYENERVIDEDENPVLIFRAFTGRIENAFWKQVKPELIRIGYDPLFGTYALDKPKPDIYEALLEQRREEHRKALAK
ncbi:MAG: hypothetical protein J6I96_02255 [Oscillospiraceae bacterium]|nr:hypothetical protein [Oscillospiraceae bacterium]